MFSEIYAITPDITSEKVLDMQHIATTLTTRNINILQYRRKSESANLKTLEATELLNICKDLGVSLIINDDAYLAAEIGADGVHLGKDDGNIAHARKLLGETAIIGVSCYNDVDIGVRAEQEGATYCAFGSVFASATKPSAPHCSLEVITNASSKLSVPVIAIGGITFANYKKVLDSGASSVAMISSLWQNA